MATRLASHGCGGFGNIAVINVAGHGHPTLTARDLETPVLRTAIVTTGRGGRGNMARNEDAHETRRWQDVDASRRSSSTSFGHASRGGAGNAMAFNETEALIYRSASNETVFSDDSEKGWTETKGEARDGVRGARAGGLFFGSIGTEGLAAKWKRAIFRPRP